MIEIRDLLVRQGDFCLEIPELRLHQGELVAVCGNNGSGKSTLLKTLAGGLPFSGHYSLGGRPFNTLNPKERARLLSFLPQNAQVHLPFEVHYVVLTGRFPLLQGKHYRAEDHHHVEEALKRFDLLALRNRVFHELSGGERQRVLLARTLVRQSPILLLDEPLNAIDLRHQHRILRFLRELRKGHLILVVMHDLGLALQYFERFLFFKEGRLLYDLPRQDLDALRLSRLFDVEVRLLECQGKYFVEVIS